MICPVQNFQQQFVHYEWIHHSQGTTSRSCLIIIIDGQLLRVFVDIIQAFKWTPPHVCYILITYTIPSTQFVNFIDSVLDVFYYIFPEILTACEMVTCKCITSQHFFIILTVMNSTMHNRTPLSENIMLVRTDGRRFAGVNSTMIY